MYGVACMKLGDVRPGQETEMLPCQPTTEIIKKNIEIKKTHELRIWIGH